MEKVEDIKNRRNKDKIAALKEIKEDVEFLIEYQLIDARIRWRKYQALLKEGFTEYQALELTKGNLFNE